jgi:NitT/TauT family transport system substrate-binding protein
MGTLWTLVKVVVMSALALTCVTATPVQAATQPGRPAAALTKVTLQLQWVTQSQFAGYYAAVDKGFYRDEGLDVAIKVGAVEIVPQQVVAIGGADFGIA